MDCMNLKINTLLSFRGNEAKSGSYKNPRGKAQILLLDEAFSALDYQTRLAVTEDIYSIIKKENKTAILVTHDIAEGISMADRLLC